MYCLVLTTAETHRPTQRYGQCIQATLPASRYPCARTRRRRRWQYSESEANIGSLAVEGGQRRYGQRCSLRPIPEIIQRFREIRSFRGVYQGPPPSVRGLPATEHPSSSSNDHDEFLR